MPDSTTASSDKAIKTAVILCADLDNPGTSLNVGELRSSLEAAFPGTTVDAVADLCAHPARLSPMVTRHGAARLVLGLCSREYSPIELQARARKVGLDPFGLEVVPLGSLCGKVHPGPQATQKAKALLAAAVARAHAYQGSRPEHAKLYLLPRNQKVTRRSLFTVPPIGYRPVPSIQRERCAAETGCQLCVRACPLDALRKTGESPLLDKARCEGCGVCLAACPREAIDFPGWSLSQFEAQLSTLLDEASPGPESPGLLLTCQRALGQLEELACQDVSYSHRWLPVVVPCLGMVTPTWMLQALAHGAETVALLTCGEECHLGQAGAIGGRANFCRRLLRLLGEAPDGVRVLSAWQPERLLQALQEPPSKEGRGHRSRLGEPLRLGTPEGAFRALRRLAAAGAFPSGVVLEHSHSPFGVLEFRAEGCTGCLACAAACPTGALASETDGDEVTLTYAASSCNGCEMCAEVCPETAAQVLLVRRMTDLDALSRGRVMLHKHRQAICEGCGAIIASRALIGRIEASLEENNEAMNTALSRYCPSCRMSFALGARPSSVQR